MINLRIKPESQEKSQISYFVEDLFALKHLPIISCDNIHPLCCMLQV